MNYWCTFDLDLITEDELRGYLYDLTDGDPCVHAIADLRSDGTIIKVVSYRTALRLEEDRLFVLDDELIEDACRRLQTEIYEMMLRQNRGGSALHKKQKPRAEKNERDSFRATARRARREVDSWPAWKKEALVVVREITPT